jgi:uncharacterized protein involved in exopolysaccharide biosynthesis/Mrp family chromosome partitioning ATPase
MNEHVTYLGRSEPQSYLARPPGDDIIHPGEISRFVKHHLLSIIICVGISVVLAGLYVGSVEPTYTARTQILIDPKTPPLVESQSRELKVSLDTAELESQMTVLRSGMIAKMVIDDLDLQQDPEFQEGEPSRLVVLTDTFLDAMRKLQLLDEAGAELRRSEILGRIGPENDDAPIQSLSQSESTQIAMERFQRKLGVSRVSMSYVIEITFNSKDPEKAARIANAIAESYTREQVQSKIAAAQQGNRWLEHRLEELRKQLNFATKAVQAFRATHDYRLPAVKDSPSGDALTVVESPTLEELETAAAAYRTMYESVLQAFTASVQHQSYPYSVMRVITPASPPMKKSQPRSKLILAFGGLVGLLGGVGLAFIRNFSDRSIRSGIQVRKELGLDCIAELPRIKGAFVDWRRLRHVYETPRSLFSQHLRQLKNVITLSGDGGTEAPRCIGVTSAMPGEGKTTIVSNLATLSTLSGRRTLVIDADVEGATITKVLGGGCLGGSCETLRAGEPPCDRIVEVPGLFDLLPATHDRCAGPGDDPGAHRVPELLDQLADEYELTIVDLPAGLTDDHILAYRSLLHGVVVVAESGRTSADAVLDLIRSLRLARVAIIGVVLTKV